MQAFDLEPIWSAVRQAWPGIEVDRARFTRFFEERAGSSDPSGLRAGDLYLVCACLDGNAGALRAFDALLDEVGRKLGRLAGRGELLAEATQVVRQVLVGRGERAAPIAEYSGRGDLGGWLRVALGREIVRLGQRERREPQAHTGELELLVDSNDDPETVYLKTHYRAEFKAAFAAALDGLDPAQRRVLRYSLVEGLSIDEVGKLEGVHRATAARQVARARERVTEETRRILREGLRLETGELESILNLIESQIDVSVRRLLKTE